VTDSQVAHLAQAETMAALAEDITGTIAAPRPDAPALPGGRRPRSMRKRLLIGVPVAAAMAVAGLIATSVGSPGQRLGPVTVGPPKAQAAVLSFTRHGRFIDVIVRDPVAGARKYRAEFARYHLDISLGLVPASPSLVGTLVYESLPAGDGGLRPITAVGKCFTGGGGNVCPVGVRVPVDFKGAASLVFGRAARPGEPYETTAAATAPGEVMHGMTYVGKTVTAVLAMLRARHVQVAHYVVENSRCMNVARRTVPRRWHISNADPWSPGEVVLWASKTWPVQVPKCASVGLPAPVPSPVASASGGAG